MRAAAGRWYHQFIVSESEKLFKTYREVVRARDRTAIFQVMGFCVVTRKQAPGKDKQKKKQVNLRGFILKKKSITMF